MYMEDIENKYLQNEIDYSNFNEQEFDNVKICKYCNCEFNHPYNNKCIILNEICDKEKLKYILENNDFNEEVNTLAKNYYDSLDNDGCKKIIYKQKNDKNSYYFLFENLNRYYRMQRIQDSDINILHNIVQRRGSKNKVQMGRCAILF